MSRAAAHVALVGLSGTGKSTVAPLLAARRGTGSADLDRLVEAAAGRSVATVFAELGEDGFRDLESAALAEVLAGPPVVLATGGGVVVREANRTALAGTCVVWLRAAPEELVPRLLTSDEERPLLAAAPLDRLRELDAARSGFYAALADVEVEVGGRDVGAVVEEIDRALDEVAAC